MRWRNRPFMQPTVHLPHGVGPALQRQPPMMQRLPRPSHIRPRSPTGFHPRTSMHYRNQPPPMRGRFQIGELYPFRPPEGPRVAERMPLPKARHLAPRQLPIPLLSLPNPPRLYVPTPSTKTTVTWATPPMHGPPSRHVPPMQQVKFSEILEIRPPYQDSPCPSNTTILYGTTHGSNCQHSAIGNPNNNDLPHGYFVATSPPVNVKKKIRLQTCHSVVQLEGIEENDGKDKEKSKDNAEPSKKVARKNVVLRKSSTSKQSAPSKKGETTSRCKKPNMKKNANTGTRPQESTAQPKSQARNVISTTAERVMPVVNTEGSSMSSNTLLVTAEIHPSPVNFQELYLLAEGPRDEPIEKSLLHNQFKANLSIETSETEDENNNEKKSGNRKIDPSSLPLCKVKVININLALKEVSTDVLQIQRRGHVPKESPADAEECHYCQYLHQGDSMIVHTTLICPQCPRQPALCTNHFYDFPHGTDLRMMQMSEQGWDKPEKMRDRSKTLNRVDPRDTI